MFKSITVNVLLISASAVGCADRSTPIDKSNFASVIEGLSEPGGFFDTDNLISNESSYLHVVDRLAALDVRDGAYIGVGPAQNFSYIAQIKPEIAYILDIRRDNLLEHLIFKALFAISDTRVEYLSSLFGSTPPPEPDDWVSADLEEIIDYVEAAPQDARSESVALQNVTARIGEFGMNLSEQDYNTIDRFHRIFILDGPALRFNSFGRAPRGYYPTLRQLILGVSLSGEKSNYLATAESFQYLKTMEDNDLIIPVVGDFAGDHALRAIGDDMRQRGLTLSAFYTSNVEYYLYENGVHDKYFDNLRQIPIDDRSVMIRSLFLATYGRSHPESQPGFPSAQLLQDMDVMLEGRAAGLYPTYRQLVSRDFIPLR